MNETSSQIVEAILSAVVAVILLKFFIFSNFFGFNTEQLNTINKLLFPSVIVSGVIGFFSGWRFIAEFIWRVFFDFHAPSDFSFYTTLFWLIVVGSFIYFIFL